VTTRLNQHYPSIITNCIAVSGIFDAGFVKTHVLDEHETQVVGEITACSSAEADSKSSLDTACKLCQLKKLPTVIVLTCDVDVKPEDTFLWTQQVR